MGLEKEMLVCVRFDWVCSVRLGLLVRIAGFVVVVGLIIDHFWTFGVWGYWRFSVGVCWEFRILKFLFVF